MPLSRYVLFLIVHKTNSYVCVRPVVLPFYLFKFCLFSRFNRECFVFLINQQTNIPMAFFSLYLSFLLFRVKQDVSLEKNKMVFNCAQLFVWPENDIKMVNKRGLLCGLFMFSLEFSYRISWNAY